MKKYFIKGFCFKTHKRVFFGVQLIKKKKKNSAFALKIIDTQMLFCQYFLKCTKKNY